MRDRHGLGPVLQVVLPELLDDRLDGGLLPAVVPDLLTALREPGFEFFDDSGVGGIVIAVYQLVRVLHVVAPQMPLPDG